MPAKGAFKRCVEKVGARGGVRSPAGVCAAAGRKKYGKRKFQAMAAAGRRRKNDSLDSTIDHLLSFSPTGSALKVIEGQREKLQKKMRREEAKKNKGRGRKNAFGFSKKETYHAKIKRPKKSRRRSTRMAPRYSEPRVPDFRTKRNSGRRNPVTSAQQRYESFHGRPSEELIEISTPMHEHSVVAGIGELRKLVVISPEGRKVTIKNFGFNHAGQPALLTMNEAATQLFIDGGDQSVNLEEFGILEPYREWETLGQVKDVYYFTTKDHLGDDGGTATYHHKFGGIGVYKTSSGKQVRRRSRLPDLIYDTRNRLLYFSGGGYTLPDEGIAN
jgi:hypothetical protein